MRVIVYHDSYGCDTGCCGHVVELADGSERFSFSHPSGDDPLAFAKELVADTFGAEHVADLAWDECVISNE